MFALKDLVNFASDSRDGKIDIFIPQVFIYTCAKFYPEVENLQKLEINLVG